MDTRKDRALDVLGAGGTQTAAAIVAGVTRTTVWRWLQDPAFLEERRRRQDRADAARAEIFDCLACRPGIARIVDVDGREGPIPGMQVRLRDHPSTLEAA